MKSAPKLVLLFLLLLLSPRPAMAGSFTLSLPADSAGKVESPSRLVFRVTNTSEREGLSALALRFPAGYRVVAGSAPPRWIVEGNPTAAGESAGISFRTRDEVKCRGAIAPEHSLVFAVEVIALASSNISPDSLVSAEAEESCQGVALDPPSTLPSWGRLGIEAALAAGPPVLGVGGVVTATLTVTNRSTVELAEVSALLHAMGTGGVGRLEGPTPAVLTLAPGASGSLTWTARAMAPGTLSFSGQAIAKTLTSPPVRSEPLAIGALEVSLSIMPEQVESGQEVQVQMTVTNRGPVRVLNVMPSPLTFDGTATPSAQAGPSPASQAALEPGESATFAWSTTMRGKGGETYAFSGWASAEWGAIVSMNAASNRGTLAQPEVAEKAEKVEWGGLMDGGPGQAKGGGGTAGATVRRGTPAAVPSATLQFIGVNHDGKSTGGVEFSGGLVRDLRILVGWQHLAGSHSQRLDLFSPDGSLYQRFTTPFADTSVETRLLVGGTWITQNSLFGAWRVEVFLDGEKMPITSGAFVLIP